MMPQGLVGVATESKFKLHECVHFQPVVVMHCEFKVILGNRFVVPPDCLERRRRVHLRVRLPSIRRWTHSNWFANLKSTRILAGCRRPSVPKNPW